MECMLKYWSNANSSAICIRLRLRDDAKQVAQYSDYCPSSKLFPDDKLEMALISAPIENKGYDGGRVARRRP